MVCSQNTIPQFLPWKHCFEKPVVGNGFCILEKLAIVAQQRDYMPQYFLPLSLSSVHYINIVIS
jgi:hypothetical protein